MTSPRTRLRLPNVLRAIGATPWAILPEKLDEILAVVELHAAGHASPAAVTNPYAARREAARGASAGGVAVIPVYGTLTQRASMLADFSGGTSAEQFGAQIDAAVADPGVATIVLDIDSPGGSTAGIPEAAAKVLAARDSKRVIAVANSLAASAAYWLASQAHEVVAAPSAIVGSIGVYTVHTDTSAADAQDGVTHTVVRFGKNKADGLTGPLSEEGLAATQALVDEHGQAFVAAIAKGRGITPAAVRAQYGDGSVFAARAALDAGLIDRIASLDEVLAGLGAARPRAAGPRADVVALPVAALAAAVTPALEVIPATPAASEAAPAPAVPSLTPHVAAPTPPAPAARSHPVDENTTAATGAATQTTPSADAIRAAERERIATIRGLADTHGADAAQVAAWVDGGASVDTVAQALLAQRRTQAAASPAVRVGAQRETQAPWANAGEFYAAVHRAHPQVNGHAVDPRLFAAATGLNQGVGSEGGFTVPSQMSTTIWDGMSQDPEALLPRTDNYTVQGESLEFLANAETARTRGSLKGGMRAYWINEADQLTKSKPAFRKVRIEPQQLGALVYVTDKLMKNSPVALEQYVSRGAQEAITFEVNDALFRGDGVGKPKGYINGGCKIQVSKETSQAAATVNQYNVSKMWARLHPQSRANAIWMINADVEPALDTLSTVVTNVAGTENVGGYQNKVWDAERRTLKGRPVVVSEFCETLGTAGDIVLVDWSSYLTGTRGQVESAMSMHVRFEYLEQAFRFVFEVDGQPWMDSAITPYKGANTQSPIITLQTR
jgi:HK97 family phage major capsid protein